jgi:hypothetical protein
VFQFYFSRLVLFFSSAASPDTPRACVSFLFMFYFYLFDFYLRSYERPLPPHTCAGSLTSAQA